MISNLFSYLELIHYASKSSVKNKKIRDCQTKPKTGNYPNFHSQALKTPFNQ